MEAGLPDELLRYRTRDELAENFEYSQERQYTGGSKERYGDPSWFA